MRSVPSGLRLLPMVAMYGAIAPMIECHIRTKSVSYEGTGRCIYCGLPESGNNLSDEHIIPYGLGGRMVFKRASCIECSNQTHAFEGNVLGTFFKIPRRRLGIKSRRKLFNTVTLTKLAREGEKNISVPVESLPKAVTLISFGYPGILAGIPSQEFNSKMQLHAYIFEGDPERVKSLTLGGNVTLTPGGINFHHYVRMLAKIAHSFAVAELRDEAFTPLLNDFIRRGAKNIDEMLYYIGKYPVQPKPGTMQNDLHEMWISNHGNFVIVQLRLFACLDMPINTVVVGNHTP